MQVINFLLYSNFNHSIIFIFNKIPRSRLTKCKKEENKISCVDDINNDCATSCKPHINDNNCYNCETYTNYNIKNSGECENKSTNACTIKIIREPGECVGHCLSDTYEFGIYCYYDFTSIITENLETDISNNINLKCKCKEGY